MEGQRGISPKRIIIDDLMSPPDSEIGISRGMKKEGGGFFKNLFVGLLLIGIVVMSFWVSFLVGKRVLLPVKTIEPREIPPPAETELPRIPPEVLTPTPEEALKPTEEPKVIKPRTYKVTGLYYKVQAGIFKNKEEASKLAEALNSSGFQTFIKTVQGSFRVQAGAFKTKAAAEILVKKLKEKGFDSVIIRE